MTYLLNKMRNKGTEFLLQNKKNLISFQPDVEALLYSKLYTLLNKIV